MPKVTVTIPSSFEGSLSIAKVTATELVINDHRRGRTLLPYKGGISMVFPLDSAPSPNEDTIFRLINIYRIAHNRPRLRRSSKLDRLAEDYATRQDAAGWISHNHGGTIQERLKKFGYNYRFAAECLASRTLSPIEIVTSWQNSPKHNIILLSPEPTHAGIGVVGDDVCLLLARPWEAGPTPFTTPKVSLSWWERLRLFFLRSSHKGK